MWPEWGQRQAERCSTKSLAVLFATLNLHDVICTFLYGWVQKASSNTSISVSFSKSILGHCADEHFGNEKRQKRLKPKSIWADRNVAFLARKDGLNSIWAFSGFPCVSQPGERCLEPRSVRITCPKTMVSNGTSCLDLVRVAVWDIKKDIAFPSPPLRPAPVNTSAEGCGAEKSQLSL